jgi:hypothetical protein
MHNWPMIRTALAAFKGNIYQKHMFPNFRTSPLKIFVIDTACPIFVLEYLSYLGKFEAEYKNA